MLVLAATACGGGDVDLSGVYEVTHHTRSIGNCDTEGEAVAEPTYFQMKKDEFFGQEYFGMSECTSADPASCDEGGFFGTSFFEAIDNGWKSDMSMTSFSGDTCWLGWGESTAILQDDDSIRIEMRMWGDEETGWTDDQCDTDEAESRGSSMPCEDYEVIVGTPVTVE